MISPARAGAFDILHRVATSDAHSDDVLHSDKMARLSQQDRNLTTALVLGTLRWQIALDERVGKLLARADLRLAEPVAIALRLGAFQLLHMDRIPVHAAIHESVELCRAAGHPHAAGMVNAILRKLALQAQAAKDSGPNADRRHAPIFESTAAFAKRLGHPVWLVERWVAIYGREQALAVCEYDQREPQPGGLFETPLTAAQIDDGSRLVAELAAAALPSSDAQRARIWDCCSAPGGKTLALAERLPRAEILATDISAKRLARMKGRIGATAYAESIRCELLDAAKAQEAAIFGDASGPARFDLVLCDAPCSGTGTLAHNPEIRHRLRPDDLARHASRQRAILRGAISRLAPGGRLLYSTCSLEPEENERVVDAALIEASGVKRISLAPALERLSGSGVLRSAADPARTGLSEGFLRTLPGVHPCDGFFAALLERV